MLQPKHQNSSPTLFLLGSPPYLWFYFSCMIFPWWLSPYNNNNITHGTRENNLFVTWDHCCYSMGVLQVYMMRGFNRASYYKPKKMWDQSLDPKKYRTCKFSTPPPKKKTLDPPIMYTSSTPLGLLSLRKLCWVIPNFYLQFPSMTVLQPSCQLTLTVL